MADFTEAGLAELHAEFEAAQRRPLRDRLPSSFVKTYKPVLDDATVRTFDTMREFRQSCNCALPEWLGYGIVISRRIGHLLGPLPERIALWSAQADGASCSTGTLTTVRQ